MSTHSYLDSYVSSPPPRNGAYPPTIPRLPTQKLRTVETPGKVQVQPTRKTLDVGIFAALCGHIAHAEN